MDDEKRRNMLRLLVRCRSGERIQLTFCDAREAKYYFCEYATWLSLHYRGAYDRVIRANGNNEIRFKGGGVLYFDSIYQYRDGVSLWKG